MGAVDSVKIADTDDRGAKGPRNVIEFVEDLHGKSKANHGERLGYPEIAGRFNPPILAKHRFIAEGRMPSGQPAGRRRYYPRAQISNSSFIPS